METFAPETAPEYVIVRDFSPFFRLGPQQPRGPDESLRVDTRVKLLRREMGYSLVQLEDSRTGYAANEDMAPAPPRPPKPPEPPVANRRSGRTPSGSPAYSGPQMNDVPLPDRELPPPDLNIEPEVLPDLVPPPSGAPTEPPKFRY